LFPKIKSGGGAPSIAPHEPRIFQRAEPMLGVPNKKARKGWRALISKLNKFEISGLKS
jgi:hypothetical protein